MKQILNKKSGKIAVFVILGCLTISTLIIAMQKQNQPKDIVTEKKRELVNAPLLKVNEDPALQTVIENYYKSMLKADQILYESITISEDDFDPSVVLRQMEYIKGYDNIKVYLANGVGAIDYVAFVEYDLKINSIPTGAPSIDRFYITFDDGLPKIYQKKLTKEEQSNVDFILNHKEVLELIQKVDSRLQAAMKADYKLYEFYQSLSSYES